MSIYRQSICHIDISNRANVWPLFSRKVGLVDQVPRVTYHILSYSNILNSLVRAALKYVGLVDQAARGNVSSFIGLRPTCALGG